MEEDNKEDQIRDDIQKRGFDEVGGHVEYTISINYWTISYGYIFIST